MPPDKPQVALICDFLEEEWPSMDLVGDMLYQHLSIRGHNEMRVTQVRPTMHFRLPQGLRVGRNADRLINRFYDYPAYLKQLTSSTNVFHIVDHSYSQLIHALPAHKTVVTCHDLDTFRCLLEPARDPRPTWFRWMTQRVLDGFRQAARVICVSSATRDELLSFNLLPPERVCVIPNGVHPSCSPEPDFSADTAADELLSGIKGAPFLLHVGSTIPRKNIEGLLRIFAAIHQKRPRVSLVRVGGPFTPLQQQLSRELGIEGSIVVLPFLERAVLAAVYRKAAALLLPSHTEGFGLPLIEAMACGCPVIANDIPVFREVGGEAACFCPANATEGWVEQTVKLMDSGAGSAPRLLDQARRYSWPETTRRVLELYQSLLIS